MFLLQRTNDPNQDNYLMLGSNFGNHIGNEADRIDRDDKRIGGRHSIAGTRARAFAHWNGYVESNA
jgi:hypothetical protein